MRVYCSKVSLELYPYLLRIRFYLIYPLVYLNVYPSSIIRLQFLCLRFTDANNTILLLVYILTYFVHKFVPFRSNYFLLRVPLPPTPKSFTCIIYIIHKNYSRALFMNDFLFHFIGKIHQREARLRYSNAFLIGLPN